MNGSLVAQLKSREINRQQKQRQLRRNENPQSGKMSLPSIANMRHVLTVHVELQQQQ